MDSTTFRGILHERFAVLPLSPATGLSIGLIFVLYLVHIVLNSGSRGKDLPPGPPTLPVIGNLAIFPKSHLHLKFTEWSKVYGDVFSLKAMSKTLIILNTPSAVHEIIDKRHMSSANRPKSIIADMITPHNLNLGTGRYANETWSVLRKSATQLLNARNMQAQRKFQQAEATQLMFDLVNDPENWYIHMQRVVTSFSLGLVYGSRSPLSTGKDVADFHYIHPQFINALELGRLPPVDLFPIMTLVPQRFANWKRVANNVRRLHETLYDRLLQRVEARLARGDHTPGFIEEAMRNSKEWGLVNRELILHLGGVLLEGSDTSSATLQLLVLALVAFPKEAKKVQEEVDRVVGNDRVPTWEDIPQLPYTMAFMEEVMRFRPVSPLGVPHEMTKDEVVDGVRYPKDATIFVNSWAIFHDERYFDRPDEFIPERFIKNQYGVKDAALDDVARRPNIIFGGGRRVCPGIVFAKSNLELNICNFVWGFEFLPALDANGKAIPPDINNISPGLTGTPFPFKCRIKPRSPQRAELIKQEFVRAGETLALYELELNKEEKLFNATHRVL